jgi:hypothetical protein
MIFYVRVRTAWGRRWRIYSWLRRGSWSTVQLLLRCTRWRVRLLKCWKGRMRRVRLGLVASHLLLMLLPWRMLLNRMRRRSVMQLLLLLMLLLPWMSAVS